MSGESPCVISTLKQRDDESVDAGEEQEEEREEHEAEEVEPRHQLVLLHHLLIGVKIQKNIGRHICLVPNCITANIRPSPYL